MASQALSLGAIVGRYRVEGLVRDDPGARIYSATGLAGSNPVTLRLIEGDETIDLEQLARYVEILSSIEHPNVVSVFEAGTHGTDLFVVRERVLGADVGSLVQRQGPFDTRAAIEIVEQTASALAELREAGITGGSLTPRNVLVDSSSDGPHVRLVDLGLIAIPEETDFIAPEVRSGIRDERSDVYALGALLFRELTGGPPASSSSGQRSTVLPDALDRVINRALREDPARRYPDQRSLLFAARNATDPLIVESIARPFSGPPPPTGTEPPHGEGGEPPDGEGGEPPRSAFALLAAPKSVVAGKSFALEIGLSATPDHRLAGDERMARPADSRGSYTLAIHVIAPSFRLRPGESWRNELRVTREDPYPRLVLHLTAKPVESSWESCLIQATYSTEGQTMGLAVRPIGVARSADLIDRAKPKERPSTSAVPTTDGWPKPDLTINILATKSHDPDSLMWTFVSRHAVELPRAQPSPLRAEPQRFAKQVIDGVGARGGALDAYQFARGVGKNVARKVPKPFWELLGAVAKKAKGPPTVLINSVDPYVPWELAVLPRPLDPTLPPFLGAQATVGRWVVDAVSPPPTPPLPREPALSMSVISGVYDRPGLTRLKAAEEEAKRLADDHRAMPVDANLAPVLACLEAQPISDLLHFAMHARMQIGGFRNGLVFENEQVLSPMTVEGLEFESAPFVFLNACQAGAGEELLGDYAGLAAAFLRAGASAVVAPLWAVDDTVARDIALRFYDDVFAAGADIAGYFRGERARFSREDQPVSTTHLAYVFYGHPTMRLHAMNQLAPDA
jgi:serine/threonine protein kinase